jgi:hypothetical protein
MRTKLFGALISILFFESGSALSFNNGQYTAYAASGMNCKTWGEYAQKQRPEIGWWIGGYMTGVNFAKKGKVDWFETDTPTAVLSITKHCQKYPTDQVVKAAETLLKKGTQK